MKLFSYFSDNCISLGCIVGDNKFVNIKEISNSTIPSSLDDYLKNFEFNNIRLKELMNGLDVETLRKFDYNNIVAPLENPKSFRDFYAFRKHVEAGRKNRGLEMIPEYDQIPVFYFSNHQSIMGPGEISVQEKHLEKLDFEFEIGLIISKNGKNIKSKDAYKHVAGLTIMNDWSAREIQMQEMKLNLGPAKGKDFATSIGPFLVTLDELRDKSFGEEYEMRYDLEMNAYINDRLVSNDNLKNITWPFSDMIERASYGVELYPGDLIGSGTCSSGCLLELNLSTVNKNWLKNGDRVKLTVDRLGTLENNICLRNR